MQFCLDEARNLIADRLFMSDGTEENTYALPIVNEEQIKPSWFKRHPYLTTAMVISVPFFYILAAGCIGDKAPAHKKETKVITLSELDADWEDSNHDGQPDDYKSFNPGDMVKIKIKINNLMYDSKNGTTEISFYDTAAQQCVAVFNFDRNLAGEYQAGDLVLLKDWIIKYKTDNGKDIEALKYILTKNGLSLKPGPEQDPLPLRPASDIEHCSY